MTKVAASKERIKLKTINLTYHPAVSRTEVSTVAVLFISLFAEILYVLIQRMSKGTDDCELGILIHIVARLTNYSIKLIKEGVDTGNPFPHFRLPSTPTTDFLPQCSPRHSPLLSTPAPYPLNEMYMYIKVNSTKQISNTQCGVCVIYELHVAF